MITHVPGPMDRLAARVARRWVRWLDGLLAEPPASPQIGPRVDQPPAPHKGVTRPEPVRPPLRGIDALIARYTSEGLSQRKIARRLSVGKGTVQRRQCAQRELVYA